MTSNEQIKLKLIVNNIKIKTLNDILIFKTLIALKNDYKKTFNIRIYIIKLVDLMLKLAPFGKNLNDEGQVLRKQFNISQMEYENIFKTVKEDIINILTDTAPKISKFFNGTYVAKL